MEILWEHSNPIHPKTHRHIFPREGFPSRSSVGPLTPMAGAGAGTLYMAEDSGDINERGGRNEDLLEVTRMRGGFS